MIQGQTYRDEEIALDMDENYRNCEFVRCSIFWPYYKEDQIVDCAFMSCNLFGDGWSEYVRRNMTIQMPLQ